jgi:hypothetical protein
MPCFWSLEPGRQFIPGGGYTTDIKRADFRLLLVAQVFSGDKLWARLPVRQEHVFHSHVRATRMASVDIVRYASRAGEQVDIWRKATIKVTFQAEHLDQSEKFLLRFRRQRVGGELGLRREAWVPDIAAL